HALATIGAQPVATGRIDVQKEGKIGRVAVLADFRRLGIGSRMMEALENFASEQGLRKVWFHAQQSAIPFYRSLGYEAVGEEFMEADIPHVMMEKKV
ncbi:MAG: GNAT family N-acetyltransferase, partial [Planctomycetota bacterium]